MAHVDSLIAYQDGKFGFAVVAGQCGLGEIDQVEGEGFEFVARYFKTGIASRAVDFYRRHVDSDG